MQESDYRLVAVEETGKRLTYGEFTHSEIRNFNLKNPLPYVMSMPFQTAHIESTKILSPADQLHLKKRLRIHDIYCLACWKVNVTIIKDLKPTHIIGLELWKCPIWVSPLTSIFDYSPFLLEPDRSWFKVEKIALKDKYVGEVTYNPPSYIYTAHE